MKIRPVGAELVRANRQTDGRTGRRDEANSRFFAILLTSSKTDGSLVQ
jgi:hypothetical protein